MCRFAGQTFSFSHTYSGCKLEASSNEAQPIESSPVPEETNERAVGATPVRLSTRDAPEPALVFRAPELGRRNTFIIIIVVVVVICFVTWLPALGPIAAGATGYGAH
jgi:hypothetical protein